MRAKPESSIIVIVIDFIDTPLKGLFSDKKVSPHRN